ncbi:MAG: NAD-dependent epimerase/dehydratase family protein [Bacteroidetes bacterium]|nr:NAD-dependent epimerase/dehydratase family protein [Bacteroidota bacterium]
MKEKAKKIVYFSTCSIYDEEVRSRSYVIHKLAMENLIINHSIKYLILRVSNVVGSGGNKNTIINYFFNNIKQKAHFILWEFAERNILDISDLVFVTDELLKNNIENKIIDIANPINFKVLEIVHSIEIFSGFKAHYESLKKGHPLSINVSYITQLIPEYASRFDTSLNYMNKLLVKYFSNE